MGRRRSSQVAAGRGSHDADLSRVYVPLSSVAAHNTQGLLGISQGHLGALSRQAIEQDKAGNAARAEKRGKIGTLIVGAEIVVTTARTDDNGLAVGSVGEEA